MNWPIFKMEEVVDIIDYRGKTPEKAVDGIITLSAKSVKSSFIDYNNAYYISKETYDKFMVRGKPCVGDILMTTEAPLGIVAKLDRDDVAIAQRLLLLRGKNTVLDNDYLMFFLQSPRGQHELLSRATGTTVTGIKQAKFREIPITVPPMNIQKKIGAHLRNYDVKLHTNLMQIDILYKIITSIYKDWFNEYNYPNATGELVFNKQLERKIPSDWHIVPFQRFLNPISERIGDTVAPIYSTTNNGIALRNEKFNKNLTKSQGNNKKVVKDDLIFGLSREILNFGVFTDEIGSVSPAYQIFKIDQSVILPFMLELEMRINMPRYMDILQLGAREGQGIRKDYLMNKYFLVPKMEVQEEFSKLYDVFQRKIAKLKEENAVLAEIKDTLLPKLMSGELPVEVGEE